MQIRARRFAIAACAAVLLPTAAGCVKLGSDQPPIVLPTLTSRPTASPSPQTKTDDQVLADSRNAIVRIEGVDCAGTYSTGSGFFFQPGFVVTAYHVVKEQQAPAVRTLSTRAGDEHVFAAQVVGHNDAADIAVLRLDDVGAESLTIADADPAVNTSVFSIGYPGGLPINLETGRVTGVDQDAVVSDGDDRRPLSGAVRFTAAPGAGTSGGPLLDATGATVGLVDTGTAADQIHFAVPATLVKKIAEAAAASPEDRSAKGCEPPDENSLVEVESSQPDAPGIATTVRAYVEGINAGNQVVDRKSGETGFEQAYRQLSGSRLTKYPTLQKFIGAHRQQISDVHITSVSYVDDTSDKVRLRYDYVNDGQSSCRTRSMEYAMSIATGAWTFADQKVLDTKSC
ncbi:S1C family serine protease [Microlunatus ginsengisoli]|uniref:Trypsin-like peptidase domain-containing protein n=1 Tax=Microlunatus ginsengisoli TaxID=363863 RepID=A0ABP7AR62_9ACTN